MTDNKKHASEKSLRAQLSMFFLYRNINKLKRIFKRIKNSAELKQRQSAFRNISLEDNFEETAFLQKNLYTPFTVNAASTENLVRASLDVFEAMSKDDMSPQEGKKFYLDCIKAGHYEPSTEFMQYALDENILKAVGAYLGTAPFLQSIELIYSIPKDPAEPLHQTHLFHKDKIDKKIVKMFTYITDVDEKCGPFTFLTKEDTSKLPWYVELPHYVKDDVIEKYTPLNNSVKFMGKSGSAVMVDTKNLFHCGSRCEKPRLTFVCHYNSGFSLFDRTPEHKKWAEKSYKLSDIQKMALGL